MKLLNKAKSDKGITNSVSFIVIILFIMTLLISFVDVGLYFNTKSQIMAAAENGARSVALYGGVNTVIRTTRGSGKSPVDVAWESIPQSLKKPGMKTVIVNKNNITCYPTNQRIKAGEMVYCDIKYTYNGIAGKFGLFQLGESKKGDGDGTNVTARGTSVSEVTIE